MRKIFFTLTLLSLFFCSVHAQEYKVVSIQGGGCLMDHGNGWEQLHVNTLLTQNSVLKNAGAVHSEVVLREVGQRNLYKVFVRDDAFSLSRFVLDGHKDEADGNMKQFSSFIRDMIKTSKSVEVTVNYDHTITTVRETEGSGISLEDNFVRNVVHAFDGVFPLESMASLSSGVQVDLAYDGERLVLTNYGDEAANCYVFEFKKRHSESSATPLTPNDYIVLPAQTEVRIPYKKSEGKVILLSSDTSECYDPYILSDYINANIYRDKEEKAPAQKSMMPFCVNIL